jgi:3-oxoadipate enol-lactonase
MSRVKVREIEVAYEEAGTGPAVLLLHGFPFNRSLWRQQVEILAPHFHVIAPDLRGHGETSVTASPATMAEMAQDVIGLMEALDIAQATLGGLSMGGYVALSLYRRWPERVRALVLADTRAVADTEEGKEAREQQAQKALLEGMAPIADAMLPKLLAPITVARRPEVVARVRDMILNTDPVGAAAAQRGMAQRIDHTDFLSRIVVPTLVIVGRHDQLTPVSESEMMHRGITGSRLQVIEDAGHISNLEQPERFNRSLSEFLHEIR